MTALELDKRICERIAKDGLTERRLKRKSTISCFWKETLNQKRKIL